MFFVRYHEIGLKGGNRSFFESRLQENLQRTLVDFSEVRVLKKHDHFEVMCRLEDRAAVGVKLGDVIGIANFSLVERCAPSVEAVAETGSRLIEEALLSRKEGEVLFRVHVDRKDKTYKDSSMVVAREVASLVLPRFERLKVKLSRADVILYVIWGKDEALVYLSKTEGAGGLPVGTAGKVVSLISSGFDSPVASWMMMKRGAKVVFVHFHSYPAVGPESIENVRALIRVLNRYQFESKLYLFPLIEYQKMVVSKAPAPLRVLLYRRMMVRLAQRVMRVERGKALITGESLGQVASQTLDNMQVSDVLAERPILRPLIGMDKRDIIDLAGRIGTAEISKQPYEDCCSLYVPRAPALAASVLELEKAEENLEVERFEALIWDGREVNSLP